MSLYNDTSVLLIDYALAVSLEETDSSSVLQSYNSDTLSINRRNLNGT